jgi:hypothetical protein
LLQESAPGATDGSLVQRKTSDRVPGVHNRQSDLQGVALVGALRAVVGCGRSKQNRELLHHPASPWNTWALMALGCHHQEALQWHVNRGSKRQPLRA